MVEGFHNYPVYIADTQVGEVTLGDDVVEIFGIAPQATIQILNAFTDTDLVINTLESHQDWKDSLWSRVVWDILMLEQSAIGASMIQPLLPITEAHPFRILGFKASSLLRRVGLGRDSFVYLVDGTNLVLKYYLSEKGNSKRHLEFYYQLHTVLSEKPYPELRSIPMRSALPETIVQDMARAGFDVADFALPMSVQPYDADSIMTFTDAPPAETGAEREDDQGMMILTEAAEGVSFSQLMARNTRTVGIIAEHTQVLLDHDDSFYRSIVTSRQGEGLPAFEIDQFMLALKLVRTAIEALGCYADFEMSDLFYKLFHSWSQLASELTKTAGIHLSLNNDNILLTKESLLAIAAQHSEADLDALTSFVMLGREHKWQETINLPLEEKKRVFQIIVSILQRIDLRVVDLAVAISVIEPLQEDNS